MVLNFLWKYIVGPIIADANNTETAVYNGITAHTGYNIYNTVAWGIIALGIILLIKKEFEKRDIELNTQTAISSIPYVLLGGILRFLEDAAILPFIIRPFAITPIIYILIAAVFIGSIPLANRMASKSSCTRDELLKNLGFLYLFPFLALTTYIMVSEADLLVLVTPVLVALALTALYYAVTRRTGYSSKEYVLVAFSQFFGGSVSMVSLSYGYEQKQLLTQAFTSVFGRPGILVLKMGIIGLAVYIMEGDLDNDQLKALALIVLYSIGLGTGLRVLLRLGMGI